MDLIPGVVLFLGAIGTVALLGWESIQNRKTITKAEIKKSRESRPDKPKIKIKSLFKRG